MSEPYPGETVVSEQTYGQQPSVGIKCRTYAREDHTHGTPSFPIIPNSMPIGMLTPNMTRYSMPGWSINTGVDYSYTAGVIYYTPIYVSRTSTFVRAAIKVSNIAALTSADIRIFNWNDGIPTTQAANLGIFDCTSLGIKENIINTTLNQGFYFIAVRCDSGNPTLHCLSPDTPSPATYISATAFGSSGSSIKVTSSYTDPAPLPTEISNNIIELLLRDN